MELQTCNEYLPGTYGQYLCDAASFTHSAFLSAAESAASFPQSAFIFATNLLAATGKTAAEAVWTSIDDIRVAYGNYYPPIVCSLTAAAGIIVADSDKIAPPGLALSVIGILFGDPKSQAISSIFFSSVLLKNLVPRPYHG